MVTLDRISYKTLCECAHLFSSALEVIVDYDDTITELPATPNAVVLAYAVLPNVKTLPAAPKAQFIICALIPNLGHLPVVPQNTIKIYMALPLIGDLPTPPRYITEYPMAKLITQIEEYGHSLKQPHKG